MKKSFIINVDTRPFGGLLGDGGPDAQESFAS